MAQVPVEVLRVGGASIENLENIVALLNHRQDAFEFRVVANEFAVRFQGASQDRFTTGEIYDLIQDWKYRIRGYHPHLIAVVDRRLDGITFGNLFGSMKQEGAHLEGMAIMSLYQIPEILDQIPCDVYLVFEFLSFAIRFLHGEGLIHDEQRGCIFDRKVYKPEIVEAIKTGHFCPTCEHTIGNALDAEQEIAAEHIFRVVRDVANSEDPQTTWHTQLNTLKPFPRVFLCHSSCDKEFVRRIATSLVNEGCRVWFDAWEIRVGDDIVQKINDGLQESDFLAVVLSHAAMESEWVKNEWTSKLMMAAGERKARILPLLLEDCKIPPLLKPLKYADFRNANEYDASVAAVLDAVLHNSKDVA